MWSGTCCMPAESGLLNFRDIAGDTNPSLPSSDECVQAVLISLSASGLSESGESRNATVGLPRRMVIMPGVRLRVSLTEHRSLNSLTNMETVGSFHDMVLLSLQYQGFPTQQPVQQHTEGPTYEVGEEPCSTHSERRRHLPTFQLTAGERLFSFLLSFFFLTSFLPAWSLVSFPLVRWKVVCLGQPLRISRAMHASHVSRHPTLPYFFSMLNQPTGML